MSSTCPKCWRTSYHPTDEAEGYCGNCHEFTGRPDGDQRYSSGSTPAGQEGEMRMPTNDEDGKAQPEMPEVQRKGNRDSLRGLPWERMERNHQQDVCAMQRTRVSLPSDRISRNLYTLEKMRWVERLLFISVGITFGITFTNILSFHMTRDHVVYVTTGLIVFMALCQCVYVYRGNKRLKANKRELDAMNEDFMKRYGLTNDED